MRFAAGADPCAVATGADPCAVATGADLCAVLTGIVLHRHVVNLDDLDYARWLQ